MSLELFGIVTIAICALMFLLNRPLREFFALLLFCAVFGAAEAMVLPALGNASLTLPYFFVPFLAVRLLLLSQSKPSLLMDAINANLWLILFTIYSLIAALIFPRLFEGDMRVFPMKAIPYRVLLTFTPQNITQSVYLILTTLTAIAAYATARTPKSSTTVYRGWALAGSAFVLFAFVDLAGFYSGLGDLMAWAKTANYAILSQSAMGLRRISGSFAEPSSFAAFGAAPLFFFANLWLSDFKAATSGALAILIAVVLALSTSSTAYAVIAVMSLNMIVGLALQPMERSVRQRKFVAFMVVMVFGAGAIGVIALLMPSFATNLFEIRISATLEKANSASALERGMWAAQGFEAFNISKGAGIGPGSFRSSGLIQAVIGSTGVVGTVCLGLYLLKIVRTLMSKTVGSERNVIRGCGIASLMTLVPALSVAPSPDPGIIFGALAGYFLGLKRRSILEARAAAKALSENEDLPDHQSRPAGA